MVLCCCGVSVVVVSVVVCEWWCECCGVSVVVLLWCECCVCECCGVSGGVVVV